MASIPLLPSRRCASLLLAMLVAVHSGCATRGPVVLESRQQAALALDRIAFVAAAATPDIRFEGIARGTGVGVASGAASTFMQCTTALGHGGCSGSACGALVVLWLGICGIAGLVGGAAGGATAPDAASVVDTEKKLAATPELKTVQASLRDQVIAAARTHGTRIIPITGIAEEEAARTRDYRPLAAAGAEVVLETALSRAGTAGAGINAPVAGYMEARIRLVRTSDNSEQFSATYLYQGGRTTFAEWSANQGERLLQMLDAGYERLGTHIYESVFLLYPYPDRDPHGAGFLAPAFGLAPVYPRTRGTLTGDRIIGQIFEWNAVDSLQPTLRWQGFPRPGDEETAPEDMKRVTRVRYDLVIAREQNNVPGEIAYQRTGLSTPEHKLETPLAANARYFWTVRARFELDGRERLTEWSSTHFIAREQMVGPSQFSFRFRTPG